MRHALTILLVLAMAVCVSAQSYSINAMNSQLDQLIGNATNSKFVDLKNTVNDADFVVTNCRTPFSQECQDVDDKMVDIQGWLLSDSTCPTFAGGVYSCTSNLNGELAILVFLAG